MNRQDQRSLGRPTPAPGRSQGKGRSCIIAGVLVITSFWLRFLFRLEHISIPSTSDVHYGPQVHSPFGAVIPEGPAVALPSILTSDEEEKSINRSFYGGKGDKAHLGGFTSFDVQGVSPTLWKHMVTGLGIKSVLDVGCGKGVSTSWFVLHELEYVACVEGSHDAVSQSIVPEAEKRVVEHDFSRGPWWPERTVDAVWCVEFSEHVGRNFQPNYLTAFRKAALVFVTHSHWGGWHHVEVHKDEWWQVRFEAAGLIYSNVLTKQMRDKAREDKGVNNLLPSMDRERVYSTGQHLYTSLQVFINPMVASLPQHAHLFAEHGCYANGKSDLECGQGVHESLTSLPKDFKPLQLTEEMDKKWLDLIKDFKI